MIGGTFGQGHGLTGAVHPVFHNKVPPKFVTARKLGEQLVAMGDIPKLTLMDAGDGYEDERETVTTMLRVEQATLSIERGVHTLHGEYDVASLVVADHDYA